MSMQFKNLVAISLSLFLIRTIYPYFITPDNIVIKNLPLIERKLDSSYESSNKNFSNNFLGIKPLKCFICSFYRKFRENFRDFADNYAIHSQIFSGIFLLYSHKMTLLCYLCLYLQNLQL